MTPTYPGRRIRYAIVCRLIRVAVSLSETHASYPIEVKGVSVTVSVRALRRSSRRSRRPLVLTCRGQLLLAAVGGVRCTAFFGVRPVVELAGASRGWVDYSLCVTDSHVFSAIGVTRARRDRRQAPLAATGACVDVGRGGWHALVLVFCAVSPSPSPPFMSPSPDARAPPPIDLTVCRTTWTTTRRMGRVPGAGRRGLPRLESACPTKRLVDLPGTKSLE